MCIYVLQNASKGFYREANENTRRRAAASAKAPLLSLATSVTTIAGRRKNRDGIRARTSPHSHAKPRIKPTGMLTSILSATYCWFSRGIPPAWPSIQVNLIYVLKFYSIDCTLDSPDFREPLRAIRDIFHCDIGFPRKGREHLWQRGESRGISVQCELFAQSMDIRAKRFSRRYPIRLSTCSLRDSYEKQNLHNCKQNWPRNSRKR